MNLVHYGLYNKYFYIFAKIGINFRHHLRLLTFDLNSLDNPPLVSIIIPYYNEEVHFRECIESVLAQTYPNIECIVVDDASTSSVQLKEIIQEYPERFTVITHDENKGLSASRNTGTRHANGEFITFLDADDVILKSSIYRRVIDLKKNKDPKVIGSFGFSAQVREKIHRNIYLLNYYGIKKQRKSLHNCNLYIPFPVHSALLDKKIFSTFSFDESYKHGGEDWKFWNDLMINDYAFLSSGYISGLYRQKKSSMLRCHSQERFEKALTLIKSAYERGKECNFPNFDENLFYKAQLNRLIFNYSFILLKDNLQAAQKFLASFQNIDKLKNVMSENEMLELIGITVCRFQIREYSKKDKELQTLIYSIFTAIKDSFH